MYRLPVFVTGGALLAATSLATYPIDQYFTGREYRQCTPSEDRCVGEHQMPYVLYAPCCNEDDVCAEVPSKESWGLFCTKGGQRCYDQGQKCAGSADHFIYQKPCCGDMDCIDDTEAGWGSVCRPRDGSSGSHSGTPSTGSPSTYSHSTAATYEDHYETPSSDSPTSGSQSPQSSHVEEYEMPVFETPSTTAPAEEQYDAPATDAPSSTAAAYEEVEFTQAAEPSKAPSTEAVATEAVATEAVEEEEKEVEKEVDVESGAECGAWIGSGDSVIIDTSGSGYGQWQNEGDGIKFDAGNWDPSMTVEPTNPIKFTYVVPQDGQYVITALTSSPHTTEHNDMWIRSPSGLEFEKPGNSQGMKYDWEKAYSNGMFNSLQLSTVDHDPHFITTGHLSAGSSHTVEIAGRSTQFKVQKIAIIKCGDSCWTYEGNVRDSLNDLSPSTYKAC